MRRYKRQSVEVGVFRRGWSTSRLNSRLNRPIYGPIDRGVAVLQFATGSFHTKKLSGRLYLIEVHFYSQNEKIDFEPPFLDLG